MQYNNYFGIIYTRTVFAAPECHVCNKNSEKCHRQLNIYITMYPHHYMIGSRIICSLQTINDNCLWQTSPERQVVRHHFLVQLIQPILFDKLNNNSDHKILIQFHGCHYLSWTIRSPFHIWTLAINRKVYNHSAMSGKLH